MTVRQKRTLFIILCQCFMLLVTGTASAADITAQLSRNPVSLDESFGLTYTAQGSVDDDPNFRPLEQDFEILQRSQSQNFQMINGQTSRTTQWQLSLMAKRAGNLNIPAISFGKDQSHPINIKVNEAAPSQPSKAGENIFLEVSIEPGEAYIQQQLVYHIRLFRAVNVSDATLSELKVSDPDAIIEQLGEEQNYETKRDGKRYLVNEINYAIFPQNSGRLTIEPVTLQGRLMQRTQGRGFRSPFGNMFEQPGPLQRWHSEALTVQVKPMSNTKGQPWLPAMGVHLSEQWPEENPVFKVGEPITRTLRLQALGVTAAQLPTIHADIPQAFKQYPDQPITQDHKTNSGITGMREEKIALVPTKPGSYTLPAIEVAWWNIQQDRLQVARIPERKIQVLPAPGSQAATTQPMAPQVSDDGLEEQPTVASTAIPKPTSNNEEAFPFHWLSLFLALGWLLTAAAWIWQQRKSPIPSPTTKMESTPKKGNLKQTLKSLQQACQDNNAMAAKNALLDWAAICWPEHSPRGLGEIAARLDGDLSAQIRMLEKQLYGQEQSSWKGEALWPQIKDYKPEQSKPNEEDGMLLSLYPR